MSNEDPDEDKVSCIVKKIRDYREITINPIIKNKKNAKEVKKQLVEELQRVRFFYNLWDKFSSGFVLGFLSGFIGLLAGFVKPEANLLNICFMALLFLAILICQGFFLYLANTYYEKMKVVEETLENLDDSKEFDEISIEEHSTLRE